jgi:hypothetical protein
MAYKLIHQILPYDVSNIITQFLGTRPKWCEYWKKQSGYLIKNYKMLKPHEIIFNINNTYLHNIAFPTMDLHITVLSELNSKYDILYNDVDFNKIYKYIINNIKNNMTKLPFGNNRMLMHLEQY